MPEPPTTDKYHKANKNDRTVVHCLFAGRYREGKAKHHIGEDDKKNGHGVDEIAVFSHPKGTMGYVSSAGEEVACDRDEVRDGTENGKGSG